MSVRHRRLESDHRLLRESFGATEGDIVLEEAVGTPPERYRVLYRVRGLERDHQGRVKRRDEHRAEIYLPATYPRQPPFCRMLTPVFHPNFAPHAICVGDHWAAGESLAALVARIAEMLAFQSYNLKSPLNGEAARWVQSHLDQLPTDERDFSTRDTAPSVSAALGAGRAVKECANCGAKENLARCKAGHVTCRDCAVKCEACGRWACLACEPKPCAACERTVCPECGAACKNCGDWDCADHRVACAQCGAPVCGNCAMRCGRCGAVACPEHFEAAAEACKRCAS